jgi:hypothetical protein
MVAVLAGHPGAVEFRCRQGPDAPPFLFRGFSSNTLGHRRNRGGRFVHGGSHAGEATLDPPGSAAASHSRPRPHARRAARHPAGSHAAANDRPAARGPQSAKPHPQSGDPVRLDLYKGGFKRILISENILSL